MTDNFWIAKYTVFYNTIMMLRRYIYFNTQEPAEILLKHNIIDPFFTLVKETSKESEGG